MKPKDTGKQVQVKLWSEITRHNRLPTYCLSMKYLAPLMVNGNAEIPVVAAEVQDELNYWNASLILFVVGRDLTMNGKPGKIYPPRIDCYRSIL